MSEAADTFLGMPVRKPARDVAPPQGWRATPLVDPFEAFCGPFFSRDLGQGRIEYGFLCDERHVNQRRVCHGGLLMTFVDHALGYHMWAVNGGGWAVTVSQSTSFLAPVRLGDFVTVAPECARKTRSLIFMRGDFQVAGETVLTAASLWKAVGSP